MKNNISLLITIIIFTCSILKAQIASDTLGCIPLLVSFKSPDPSLTRTAWDFKDGASSDLLNPSHVFIKAGTYFVTLKNADTLVTTVKIVILPELILNISVDTNQGCAPISIFFNDVTPYSNEIMAQNFLWDFGDGTGSTSSNPTHTYTDIGNFDVTLTVNTNIEQCDVTQTFSNMVSIENKQNVQFSIDKIEPLCTFPTYVFYKNTGNSEPGNQYLWDFGNGVTSTKAQPEPVLYESAGNYTVVLKVDNNKGCQSNITFLNRLEFYPKIDIGLKDTFCLGQALTIDNRTVAKSFFWNFGPNAKPSSSIAKNPEGIKYLTEGIHQIILTAESESGCKKDTVFPIKINKIDASFTMDPAFGCVLPLEVKFSANDKTFIKYEWNQVNGPAEILSKIDTIKRDTFYYNKLDSLPMILKVTALDGCQASDTLIFYYQLPNSQFTLNDFEGEAPFFLKVEDKSESYFPIVKWIFTWGDGTSSEYTISDIATASHLYTEPGKYYVNLMIINEAGCIDEYYGAWITVHEKPEFLDPTTCNGGGSVGEIICYKSNFTLILNNVPPQFDAFHFKLGNTVSHCESEHTIVTEALDDPGTYDLGATLENGGVFYEFEANNDIVIHGAKAKIAYQTNCKDKNLVFFENKSINDLSHYWLVNGQTITADTFSYRFPDKSEHKVLLIAENETVGCKPDTAEVIIFIRDVKSRITTPLNWCADIPTFLSSSLSQDEVVGCKMGYFWSFPGYLDMEHIVTDKDTLEVKLPKGKHRLSLEVRDVNGCRDTSYIDVTVHTLQADFVTDKPAICDSVLITCTDRSQHDNPIVQYNWNLQPEKNLPVITHLFNTLDDNAVRISLSIKDIYGCESSITKIYDIYQPSSEITYDSIMCVSNLKEIHASDFNDYGSSLSFHWRINDQPIAGQQILNLSGLSPGIHDIKLNITEKATMCKNEYMFKIKVLNDPVAIIGGLEDSLFCHPKSFILLADQSTKDPEDILTYQWDFGNNKSSSKRNPAVTYGKGEYTIYLTANSKFGCENTTQKTITLVGPEGKIIADKDMVCKGESVIFQLKDAIDVTSFYWDFGQGETNNGISPSSYQYNYVPESGKTFVSLVLESSDTGCETVLTVPVYIHQVTASFLPDTTCNDSMFINNQSFGADRHIWKYNEKILSEDANPWINIGNPGTYPLQLIISNNSNGCKDTTENLITFLPRPVVNHPKVLQLCAEETFSFSVNPQNTYNFSPSGIASLDQNEIFISTQKSDLLQITATGVNGCVTNSIITISHSEYNNMDFNAQYLLCDDFSKVNLILGLKSGETIVWNLNSGNLPSGYLSCDTCDNPLIIRPLEGELKANVLNENECLQRTYYYYIENAQIEIPNFFSPNNDSVNDNFGPVMRNLVSLPLEIEQIKIYNRWGNEVYKSDKIWDGNIDGKNAPAEVYYYTMTYYIGKSCYHTAKGNVTLMR